jgi:hypothetical protein
MIEGLPVSSFSQCKKNRHAAASVELFQTIGRFKPTFIEACHSLKTMSNAKVS